MCGRYALFSDTDISDIREMIRDVESRISYGDVYPTNSVPILVSSVDGTDKADKVGNNGSADEKRPSRFDVMAWGFPQARTSGVIINARSETASEKPLFRNSLFSRRCAAVSTGYYEWKTIGKRKEKHLITLADSHVLYLAGIYNQYPGSGGRPVSRFVILTTEANDSVSSLHDRMPVVLRPFELSTWFSPSYASLFDRSAVALSCKSVEPDSEMQQTLF